ncbi:MAG TPA: hypothetical protein VH637_22180 [Streptosporangiaceae bacterium]|jgi:hypothetical protein
MTDRTTRTARITPALAIVVLTAVCTACTVPRPALPQQAAARPAPSSPAPARAVAPAPRLAALLPDSPAWIEAAAGLAARFAAAYTTWSWRQPPAAYLARLRPLTAAALYPALARAAGTPGILARRDRARLAAAGTVTRERIRGLTPGSVIITVQVRQVITTTRGHREVPDDLAVTVIRAGRGQAVWDVEPAAAGNTAGGAADAPAP